MARSLAIILIIASLCNLARGQDEGRIAEAYVLGRLIYAGEGSANVPSAEKIELSSALGKSLAKVIPNEKSFRLLKEERVTIYRAYENWVAPIKQFMVRLDYQGKAANKGTKLHLQLWQNDRVLLKSDTIMLPKSPLIFEGPAYENGKLIMMLELEPLVKEEAEKTGKEKAEQK